MMNNADYDDGEDDGITMLVTIPLMQVMPRVITIIMAIMLTMLMVALLRMLTFCLRRVGFYHIFCEGLWLLYKIIIS